MREFSENNFQKRFSNAIEILKIINDSGYQAYFVGGCVRDYLLGQNSDDIDITSSARPEEIKEIFPKTFDTGIKHGTVTVIHKGNTYEITTFRSESDYEKHRSPKSVEFIRSLDLDLERRDFTINAMVLDKDGNLTDLHSGQADLQNKIIRTVNEPNERFNEDALRMLRAFRFASKLNFSIDENTFKAIVNNKELMTYISIERVVAEFKKIFKGKNLKNALKQLVDSDLCSHINFFSQVKDFGKLENTFTWEESLFYLLDLNNIEFTDLKKLKLSNKEYTSVKEFILIKESFETNKSLERILYTFDKKKIVFVNRIFKFVEEKCIDSIKLEIENFNDVDISINELVDFFPNRKAGPWIKEISYLIEEQILHKKIDNTKSSIKEFLKKLEG